MRKHFLLFGTFLLLPVAGLTNEIWVGSYFGDNITWFDASNGNNLGIVGTGKLDGTLGMTVGNDGNVYVASEVSGSIEKFSTGGTWLSRHAVANSPTGIAFDSTGRGYVAQFNTNSVTRYSPSGTLLGNFGAPGSGGLSGPDLGV